MEKLDLRQLQPLLLACATSGVFKSQEMREEKGSDFRRFPQAKQLEMRVITANGQWSRRQLRVVETATMPRFSTARSFQKLIWNSEFAAGRAGMNFMGKHNAEPVGVRAKLGNAGG